MKKKRFNVSYKKLKPIVVVVKKTFHVSKRVATKIVLRAIYDRISAKQKMANIEAKDYLRIKREQQLTLKRTMLDKLELRRN